MRIKEINWDKINIAGLSKIKIASLNKKEKAKFCFRTVQVLESIGNEAGYYAEIRAVGKINQMWREVGKLLEIIHISKLYKSYSSDVKTWSEFIKSIDIGIGVSEADHLRRVSRVFELYLEGRNIKFKRLLDILPVVNDRNRDELLNAAEHLPFEEFNHKIRELKSVKTTDACEHPETEPWAKCIKCGQFLKL